MKKYNVFTLIIFSLLIILSSCDKSDVFTGSPVGTNVEFVNLVGVISSPETKVAASQNFPITVTLPQSFAVEVTIQTTAFLANINKKTTKSVVIPAGQTTITYDITAPGGDLTPLPFNMNLEVFLTAITTSGVEPSGFSGKQYTLTSNKLNLDYGDTGTQALNINRLGVRFDFPFPPGSGLTYNNLNIVVKRNGVVIPVPAGSTNTVNGSTAAFARYETVNILNTALDAIYTIEVYSVVQIATPINMPYRFTIRYPNDSSKTYAGIIPSMTIGNQASAIKKIEIIKSTVAGKANYVVTHFP
jgi:hypothetical protein